jgi:uncharacterized cupredoxin-like copper-binding protein
MNAARHWLLAAAIVVVGASMSLAIACSDDSDDDGDNGGDATATEVIVETPETTEAHAEVLHIELSEWTITGEDGGPIPSAVAGNLTFEVHNNGTTAHEVVIIKTDTDPATLPVSESKVDEAAAGEIIGEVEEFAVGVIETGTFDLAAGTYALICNIPAHYEQGMYATLTVQ